MATWHPVAHCEGLHLGPTRVIVARGDFERLATLLFEPYGSLRFADVEALLHATECIAAGDWGRAIGHLRRAWKEADAGQEQDGYFQTCDIGIDFFMSQPGQSWVQVQSASGCLFRIRCARGTRRLGHPLGHSHWDVRRCIEVQIDTRSIDRPPMSDRERETHGYWRLGRLYGALHDLWVDGCPMEVDLLLPDEPYPVDVLQRAVADPPWERRWAAAEGCDSAPDPEPAATEAPTLTGPPVVVRKPRPRREEG